MGSVISLEKCPHCEGVMNVDYDYKRFIEHSLCLRCGYTSMVELVKGVVKEAEGYGIVYLKDKEGVGSSLYVNEKPLTYEDMKELEVTFSNGTLDVTKSFVSSFVDGKVKLILGRGIPNIHCYSFDKFKAMNGDVPKH